MTPRIIVTPEQAARVGQRLRINFDVIRPACWRRAMQIEMEHSNVTGGSLLTTGRIALAHLCEFPDYYTRLERLERQAERYWRRRRNSRPRVTLA